MKTKTTCTVTCRKYRSGLAFAGLTTLLISPLAGAEQTYQSERLVITASRVSQSIDDALASVTVLDREDIEQSQATDLLDLLKLQAGIDVARTGGPGSQTSVFVRGANANHTLVLVDGVRVASVQSGAFAWENLPLSQVERIEIVRGPRASFYGSDAIGGVIQIFTRQHQATELRALAGSFGTYQLEAGSNIAIGQGKLWASLEYRDSDGFSAQNPNGFSFDPDDDGFRNAAAIIGLNQPIANAHQLRAQLRYSDARVDFDQGQSETESWQADLSLSGDLGQNLKHTLTLGLVEEDRLTPAFFSRFQTQRTDLNWQFDYAGFAGQQLSAGINYVAEDGLSQETFAGSIVYDQSRHNSALFAGWQTDLGQHALQISGRYDDNSEFGGQWTGNGALQFELARQWRLIASYGTAFRAPTLSEQFSPGFGGLFAGNPNLEPEKSNSAELELRFAAGRHRLGISLFDTRIDDLIDFSGEDFQAINLRRVKIRGLEARWAWDPKPWQLEANLTLQDSEDRDSGAVLLRRPDEKLSLTLDRPIAARTSVGMELFYSGKRHDFGAVLGNYTLLNLRARYALTPHWTAEARVENLLDEEYELAAGFNTPGLSGQLALRWNP